MDTDLLKQYKYMDTQFKPKSPHNQQDISNYRKMANWLFNFLNPQNHG